MKAKTHPDEITPAMRRWWSHLGKLGAAARKKKRLERRIAGSTRVN